YGTVLGTEDIMSVNTPVDYHTHMKLLQKTEHSKSRSLQIAGSLLFAALLIIVVLLLAFASQRMEVDQPAEVGSTTTDAGFLMIDTCTPFGALKHCLIAPRQQGPPA